MTGPKQFGSVLSKILDPKPADVKEEEEVTPVIYGNTDITEMISQGIVLQKPDPEDIAENKVWCVHSAVREHPVYGGNAAYSCKDFAPGECVEWGKVHRAPEQFAGQQSQYVFTWSDDRKVWGMGSGTMAFYNTALEEDANCKMIRFFDEDRYEVYAKKHIKVGDELVHTYRSLKWRSAFNELNDILEDAKAAKKAINYKILLLITDGDSEDMDAAIEQLQKGADQPLSVIIIGVGEGKFDNLIKNYGNDQGNVQFAKYSEGANLAETVLKSIPAQVCAHISKQA